MKTAAVLLVVVVVAAFELQPIDLHLVKKIAELRKEHLGRALKINNGEVVENIEDHNPGAETQSPPKCEGKDWIASPMSTCFKFFTNLKLNWDTAQGLCQDMGGSLASLETLDKIYWMKGIQSYQSKYRGQFFWLSGHLRSGKLYWEKYSGSIRITVSDWAPGQPDNYGNRENCVHLRNNSDHQAVNWYQWNDLHCNKILPFICEREQK